MQTLESLKKKIKTTHDLLSVVKTMKSLAAVNIRQYEGAVASLERYSQIVDLGWQVLFRTDRMMVPTRTDRQAVYLVFGSDQGMCGRFNETILNLVREKETDHAQQGIQLSFWTAGERVKAELSDAGKSISEHFNLPGSFQGINLQVQQLVQAFESWQRQKGIEVLYVFFNQMVKGSGFKPVCRRILPLDDVWLKHYINKPWPSRCLPRIGLSRNDIFRHLFRQYIFVSIFRAFAQSLASENAARLQSMQAAEKNILDLEENLQARFRETRQSNITAELLDIISGFEAIKDVH